jgi:hypothetical protein
MMNFFVSLVSSIPLQWWTALIACALGITAMCVWSLESDASRSKRVNQKTKKELRTLANKISSYAQNVHQRFPNGDVIVSVPDLAQQLRKRPDAVITALNLLLNEQKVHRAPLKGYWKLNS